MLGSANYWWLRSAYNANNFSQVNNNGNENNNNANNSNGLVLGFNTGSACQSTKGNQYGIEGADNLPAETPVNIQIDGIERTLLAWAEITVIRFHGRYQAYRIRAYNKYVQSVAGGWK